MKRGLALALMLVVSAAHAQTQPRFAKDVAAKPGELIVISANVKGDVGWLWDARDFDQRHSIILAGENKLILVTSRPGVYSINLIAWEVRKVEQVLVTVEGIPDPKPDPKPEPDTPLAKSLKAAYALELDVDKASVPAFAAACRRAAAAAASDQSLTLVKQVNDLWMADMKQTIGNGCPNLRVAVNAELNAKLPRVVTTPLNEGYRKVISGIFNDLAAGLEVLR